MKHVTFATFDDRVHADEVAGEIARDPVTFGRCDVVVHPGDRDDDDVSLSETDVVRWLGWGVLWGGLAGGAVGAAVGALLLTHVGPALAAVFGAGAGAVWAGLNGALTGTTGRRRDFERAAGEVGGQGAVVSVGARGAEARDRVVAFLSEHGGRAIRPRP